MAVSEGDAVDAGDVLVVLEAMKMENDVVASHGGTVTQVAVSEDDSVDMDDVLVVIGWNGSATGVIMSPGCLLLPHDPTDDTAG